MHAHGSADFEHNDRVLCKRVDRDRLLASQGMARGHRYVDGVGFKLDELDVFGDLGEELVDKLRDKQNAAGVLVVSDLTDDFLAVFLGREDGHVRVVRTEFRERIGQDRDIQHRGKAERGLSANARVHIFDVGKIGLEYFKAAKDLLCCYEDLFALFGKTHASLAAFDDLATKLLLEALNGVRQRLARGMRVFRRNAHRTAFRDLDKIGKLLRPHGSLSFNCLLLIIACSTVG